jgi:hypothetical protein
MASNKMLSTLSMLAPVLYPSEWLDWLGSIARRISEIGERHRFRPLPPLAAAAPAPRPAANEAIAKTNDVQTHQRSARDH